MKQSPASRFVTFLAFRKNKLGNAEAESRFLQFSVICCAGVLAMTTFGIANCIQARYGLCLLLFISSASLVWGWTLLFRGRGGKIVYRANCLLFCIILCYLMYLGGEENSMILWMNVAPLIGFILLGRTEGLVWAGCLWVFLATYFSGLLKLQGAHVYSPPFSVRFLVTFTIILVITYFYENFRHISRVGLEEKNKQLKDEITEREKIEISLRESEERYRAIYLHAAEGIILVNFQGNIVDCNPQILKMLGYRKTDLLGRNILTMIHEQDLAKLPPQLGKLRSGETLFIERRLRTASGAYLLCEQSGKKINEDLIILLYRDITDRKVAEIALEKANEALDRLAHVDGLTQIANRRKFDQVLSNEWQRMQREGKQLGVMMADIDYFKQFNDVYGHQAGDDCLRNIASLLSVQVHRPADIVARYGGEEFVVLLPDTDCSGCMQIAERMRQKVEALRIPHAGSKVHTVVTVSLGVATTVTSAANSADQLLLAADKALYRAKELGRNRVCGESSEGDCSETVVL